MKMMKLNPNSTTTAVAGTLQKDSSNQNSTIYTTQNNNGLIIDNQLALGLGLGGAATGVDSSGNSIYFGTNSQGHLILQTNPNNSLNGKHLRRQLLNSNNVIYNGDNTSMAATIYDLRQSKRIGNYVTGGHVNHGAEIGSIRTNNYGNNNNNGGGTYISPNGTLSRVNFYNSTSINGALLLDNESIVNGGSGGAGQILNNDLNELDNNFQLSNQIMSTLSRQQAKLYGTVLQQQQHQQQSHLTAQPNDYFTTSNSFLKKF
jgi:hypothetical protein